MIHCTCNLASVSFLWSTIFFRSEASSSSWFSRFLILFWRVDRESSSSISLESISDLKLILSRSFWTYKMRFSFIKVIKSWSLFFKIKLTLSRSRSCSALSSSESASSNSSRSSSTWWSISRFSRFNWFNAFPSSSSRTIWSRTSSSSRAIRFSAKSRSFVLKDSLSFHSQFIKWKLSLLTSDRGHFWASWAAFEGPLFRELICLFLFCVEWSRPVDRTFPNQIYVVSSQAHDFVLVSPQLVASYHEVLPEAAGFVF